MKQSLFVLVGAGAGQDISTASLTAELVGWDELRAPGTQALEPRSERQPFFQWLMAAAKSAYPDPPEPFGFRPAITKPSFEELIHLVERLSYLLNEQYYDSPYSRPPPYEADFFELSPTGRELAEHKTMSMYDVVISASNHILDVVAQRAAANPEIESAKMLHKIRSPYVTKVFSLNYDTRIVYSEGNWWTGFAQMTEAERAELYSPLDRRQVFRYEMAIPAERDAFIQLHGSTHFTWIEDYIAPRYKVARFPEPLLRHRTPRREGFELWNDRTALPTLPMITGFRKGEKTLIEPYLSYVHYLRMEAYRTPFWIIVGYGAGDPHVNAILRSAADHWGGALRAFVFNYMDDAERNDEQLRARASHARLQYLGRHGRTAMVSVDCENTVLRSQCVMLTTDGHYACHLERLANFLAG